MLLARLALAGLSAAGLVATFVGCDLLIGQVPESKILIVRVLSASFAIIAALWCLGCRSVWASIDRWTGSLSSAPSNALCTLERAAPLEKRLTVIYLILVGTLSAYSIADAEGAAILAAEDGPLENLTALFYLVACAGQLRLATRTKGLKLAHFQTTALAVLFFVIAMEEISWGQRLLGFTTPGLFLSWNTQGEVTVHNLLSSSINEIAALTVAGILLLVIPALDRNSLEIRRLFERLQVPRAPIRYAYLYATTLAFLFGFGIKLGAVRIAPLSGYTPNFKTFEYVEFFLGFVFMTLALSAWRIEKATVLRDLEPADGNHPIDRLVPITAGQ